MENRYYHSTRGSGKLSPKEAVLRASPMMEGFMSGTGWRMSDWIWTPC